jgi:hypothetical protein
MKSRGFYAYRWKLRYFLRPVIILLSAALGLYLTLEFGLGRLFA